MPNRFASSARGVLLACAALGGCRQTVLLDPGSGQDGGGSFGDDGGGFGDRGGSDWCGSLSPVSRAPDVILAVDRSAMMQTLFGNGGGTRLDSVHQQLLALVQSYQTIVRFGYEEFPDPMQTCPSGTGMGGPGPGMIGCCAGDAFEPIPGAFAIIQSAVHACDGSGGLPPCPSFAPRPIAEALSRCRQAYTGLTDGARNRYVVLVTGGEPTCTPDGTLGSACSAARSQASNLISIASVKTFVVAVGAELGASSCLDQIALVGGEQLPTEPSYYLARTPVELTQVLSGVVDNIAHDACHLDLPPTPMSGDTDRAALFFDGKQVDRGGADGWDFDTGSPFRITLHGAACTMFLAGPVQVELLTACPRH